MRSRCVRLASGVRTVRCRLDAELSLLLACTRRRRELAAELLVELNRAIEVQQPQPRTIPAKGYREVGMARFRNVRNAALQWSGNGFYRTE